MGFRLANMEGRAVLVDGEHYFDLPTVSGGELPSDPMDAWSHLAELTELGSALADHAPTGRLADAVLGPPVPRPQKSFAVGLNYLDHAPEGSTTRASWWWSSAVGQGHRPGGCVGARGRADGRPGHLGSQGPVRCEAAALRSGQAWCSMFRR